MQETKTNYSTYHDIEIFEGTISNHIFPLHFHDCYTIILVEDGYIDYYFKEDSISLQPNDFFIINPGEAHYNSISKPTTYKAIFLPPRYFTLTCSKGKTQRFARQAVHNQDINKTCRSFIEKIKHAQDEPGFMDDLNNLMQQAAALIGCLPDRDDSNERIIEALKYIDLHIDQKITIEELLKVSYLSKFHFQRIFKSATGLTVNEYIQQQRTEKARQLLSNGNKIKDTAYQTGYYDTSHLYKAFKKMWFLGPADVSRK